MMFQLLVNIPGDIDTGFPITQSVVDGKQQGKVYEYQDNYFVVHKAGFCSLVAQSYCFKELVTLFKEEGFLRYFHIYNAPAALIDIIIADDEFNYKQRERVRLEFKGQQDIPVKNLEDFYCEDVSIANVDSVSDFNLDLYGKFWNSREQFIDEAMGAVVFNSRHEAVSICYAAAIAKGKAEVDVFTRKDHRGQGLAFFSVSAFISNCVSRDIFANWDCFKENISSLRTAEKLGFEKNVTYQFLSIYNLIK